MVNLELCPKLRLNLNANALLHFCHIFAPHFNVIVIPSSEYAAPWTTWGRAEREKITAGVETLLFPPTLIFNFTFSFREELNQSSLSLLLSTILISGRSSKNFGILVSVQPSSMRSWRGSKTLLTRTRMMRMSFTRMRMRELEDSVDD